MAFIDTVPENEAEGRLGRIYEAARKRAGRVFQVLRIMSLDPAILDASMALYLAAVTRPHSPLPRWFRELIAVKVSEANRCFY